MNKYNISIVDLLIKNIGISKCELFNKSGLSKREFLNEINRLLAEHRISNKDNRLRYSPKILTLVEADKKYSIKTSETSINFIPTKVLEKELEYVNDGTEQEDCLEFELQITGYALLENYKTIIEKNNNLNLDYTKYKYYLWSQFLYPEETIDSNNSIQKAINVIYVDNDQSYSRIFTQEMKNKFVPNSNWYLFENIVEATEFLETNLEKEEWINLIITEDNKDVNGVEFIEAIQELECEYENKYSEFYIPKLLLTENPESPSLYNKSTGEPLECFHYSKSEDINLLGKFIKSLCISENFHFRKPVF